MPLVYTKIIISEAICLETQTQWKTHKYSQKYKICWKTASYIRTTSQGNQANKCQCTETKRSLNIALPETISILTKDAQNELFFNLHKRGLSIDELVRLNEQFWTRTLFLLAGNAFKKYL